MLFAYCIHIHVFTVDEKHVYMLLSLLLKLVQVFRLMIYFCLCSNPAYVMFSEQKKNAIRQAEKKLEEANFIVSLPAFHSSLIIK